MLELRVSRRGLPVNVIAGSLEMIHALASAERGITRIARPCVLRGFHFLCPRDILFVLVIRVVGSHAGILGGGPSKGGIAGARPEIRSLAHAER